jgi:hypothetical protein
LIRFFLFSKKSPSVVPVFSFFPKNIFLKMLRKILSILVLFPMALQAQSFEGVVELARVGPDGTARIKWFVKPGKLALETVMTTQEGTFTVRSVPDPAAGVLHLRILGKDGEKTYHVPAAAIAPGGVPANVLPVKGAAGTDPVLGKYQEIVVNTGTGITRAKIALDVDVDFRQFAAFFLQDESLRALANMQLPGLPVEAVTQSLGGEETARLTFVGLSRQRVDESEFAIP